MKINGSCLLLFVFLVAAGSANAQLHTTLSEEVMTASPCAYLDFADDGPGFQDKVSGAKFRASATGTVGYKQPGYDADHVGASLTYDAFVSSPDNKQCEFDWSHPFSVAVQLNRSVIDQNMSIRVPLVMKGHFGNDRIDAGDSHGQGFFFYLLTSGWGMNACLQISAADSVGAASSIITCSPIPIINGFNYTLEATWDGSGDYNGAVIWVNGIGSNQHDAGGDNYGGNYGVRFGSVATVVSGGRGYPNTTAFTSSGGGPNCHVAGTLVSTQGVPASLNYSQNYGCTSVPTLTLAPSGGAGVGLAVSLVHLSTDASSYPLYIAGDPDNFIASAGANIHNAHTKYISTAAVFNQAISVAASESLFVHSNWYRQIIAPAPPVPVDVILTNDGCQDSDNFNMIAYEIALEKLGYVHIRGLNNDKGDYEGAAFYRQMLDSAGLTQVPVSVSPLSWPDRPALFNGAPLCQPVVLNQYSTNYPTDPSKYPTDVTVFRTVLSQHRGVKVIGGGPQIALYRLMTSPPDAISPLTGQQLFDQGMEGVYLQAGGSGSWQGGDNNYAAVSEGQYVYTHNGNVPMKLCGGNGSIPIGTGPGAGNTRTGNDPFAEFTRLIGGDTRAGYDSWCAIAATPGAATSLLKVGQTGTAIINNDASVNFTTSSDSHHSWMYGVFYTGSGGGTVPIGNWYLNSLINKTVATPDTTFVGGVVNITLAASAEPSIRNDAFTITANLAVPGTAGTAFGGKVSFLLDGVSLGEAAVVNNSASITAPAGLANGKHQLVANWSGDAKFAAAAAAASHQVTSLASSIVLSSSLNPAIAGQAVTFTASLGATPPYTVAVSQLTGTLSFYDGATLLGGQQPSQDGFAFTSKALSPGTHRIKAIYSGDSQLGSSESAEVVEVVNSASTAVAISASADHTSLFQPVTFSISLPNEPSGGTATVALLDNGTAFATVNVAPGSSGGTTYSFGSVGTHVITASYPGDATHAPGTSTVSETVLPIPTAVLLSAATAPVIYGAALSVTAQLVVSEAVRTVEGQKLLPGATIVFSGAPGTAGTPVSVSGTATGVFSAGSPLPVGAYTVHATFPGSADLLPSDSAPFTFSVVAAPTTTTLTVSSAQASAGQAVTLTAQTAGALLPAGSTVQFVEGASVLGTAALVNGTATLLISTLPAGSHVISSRYAGDANHAPSQSATTTVAISSAGFEILIPSTDVSVQSGHHTTIQLTVQSVAGFAGNVSLQIPALPPAMTATLRPTTFHLDPGTPQTVTLDITASAVPGLVAQGQPASDGPTGVSIVRWSMLPFALLPLLARKRRRRLVPLLAVLLSVGLFAASGCGSNYVNSTPAGTYVLQIKGTSAGSSLSANAQVTVSVLP